MAASPDQVVLRAPPETAAQDTVAQVPARLPPWLDEPAIGPAEKPRLRLRTVWISDIHLGTPGCSAELLLDFLKSIECDTLYLVGDVLDMWRVKRRGWYWQPSHNDVVRRILKLAKRGTRVLYLPGNHDEALRDYEGLSFGDIRIAGEAIHVTADGRRLLVLHGDRFDGVVLFARWLAFLGDAAYELLLKGNTAVNRVRRWCGRPYWSLAGYAKKRVKNAVQFIGRYEQAVAHAARERGVDGVVCGHIHTPEIRDFDGVAYYNCGDWVESCTALVEHPDGSIALLDWPGIKARSAAEREAAAAAEPVGVPALA